MSKSVVLSSVAAASVCLAALSAVANINDALVYDMALIPTDGPVTKDHIYNRFSVKPPRFFFSLRLHLV